MREDKNEYYNMPAEAVRELRAEIERLTGLWKAAEAQEWRELQEARAMIERLQAALTKEQCDHLTDNIKMGARIERLEAALEPFARNVEAMSLTATLGHITREDLWRARDALAGKEG